MEKRRKRSTWNTLWLSREDESELIQFSLVETDIKPSLRQSGESELTYELIIPFHRLAEGGLSSIDKLSVGIVTESPEAQSQGGGGGMGGPGQNSMSSAIDIWFQVDLNRK